MEINKAFKNDYVNVSGVYKNYKDEPILEDISFDLPDSGLVIITGPSGSGKSTLLRILCGIEAPDNGEVVILGQSITNISDKERRSFAADHIGLALQDPLLDRNLTVFENIVLPNEAMGRPIDLKKLARISHYLELSELLEKPIKKLSGGQQMKVSIIRGLIANNDILFTDEPTNHLDTKNKIKVLNAIRNNSSLAIVVTHDTELARKVATKEIRMINGRADIITNY